MKVINSNYKAKTSYYEIVNRNYMYEAINSNYEYI